MIFASLGVAVYVLGIIVLSIVGVCVWSGSVYYSYKYGKDFLGFKDTYDKGLSWFALIFINIVIIGLSFLWEFILIGICGLATLALVLLPFVFLTKAIVNALGTKSIKNKNADIQKSIDDKTLELFYIEENGKGIDGRVRSSYEISMLKAQISNLEGKLVSV